MIRGGGGHLERVIRGEGVIYRGVLPMHKCCVGRVGGGRGWGYRG